MYNSIISANKTDFIIASIFFTTPSPARQFQLKITNISPFCLLPPALSFVPSYPLPDELCDPIDLIWR